MIRVHIGFWWEFLILLKFLFYEILIFSRDYLDYIIHFLFFHIFSFKFRSMDLINEKIRRKESRVASIGGTKIPWRYRSELVHVYLWFSSLYIFEIFSLPEVVFKKLFLKNHSGTKIGSASFLYMDSNIYIIICWHCCFCES